MLTIGFMIGLYILPGIIATARGTRNSGAVWGISLFLGWTGIGWLIALVMSITGNTAKLTSDIDPMVLRYLEDQDRRNTGNGT